MCAVWETKILSENKEYQIDEKLLKVKIKLKQQNSHLAKTGLISAYRQLKYWQGLVTVYLTFFYCLLICLFEMI